MSYSYLPLGTRYRLWAKAAGRCEYLGCNEALWRDAATQTELNKAYIAHIVADSPAGPRGDAVRSELLKFELANLMLLCDVHHRLIDREGLAEHPEARLLDMKARHEHRIEMSTAATHAHRSHVVFYGANVGKHGVQLTMEAARAAMLPDWHPADPTPRRLGMTNSTWDDRNAAFWSIEGTNLRAHVDQQIRQGLRSGDISHMSLFGFAPQPLLTLFGALITDIPAAETYQLRREPRPGWQWRDDAAPLEFEVERPNDTTAGRAALALALSFDFDEATVRRTLPDATIWWVRVPNPHNDLLTTRAQLSAYRTLVRSVLAEVKRTPAGAAGIHVFPSVPVAMAVDFGRVLTPKACPPIHLYDYCDGDFRHAFEVQTFTERSTA